MGPKKAKMGAFSGAPIGGENRPHQWAPILAPIQIAEYYSASLRSS